jgi:hypothetical protein
MHACALRCNEPRVAELADLSHLPGQLTCIHTYYTIPLSGLKYVLLLEIGCRLIIPWRFQESCKCGCCCHLYLGKGCGRCQVACIRALNQQSLAVSLLTTCRCVKRLATADCNVLASAACKYVMLLMEQESRVGLSAFGHSLDLDNSGDHWASNQLVVVQEKTLKPTNSVQSFH